MPTRHHASVPFNFWVPFGFWVPASSGCCDCTLPTSTPHRWYSKWLTHALVPLQARAREERARLLKRAAFIAKEVRRFWDKCGAVLDYCDRQEVEARKRELLDSELDSFVGQSEQFARLLVARKDGSAAGAGAADADTDGDDDAQDDDDDDLASLQSEDRAGESDGESDEFDGAMEVDDDDDDEATLAAEEAAAAAEGAAAAPFVDETGARGARTGICLIAGTACVPLALLCHAFRGCVTYVQSCVCEVETRAGRVHCLM